MLVNSVNKSYDYVKEPEAVEFMNLFYDVKRGVKVDTFAKLFKYQIIKTLWSSGTINFRPFANS